MLTLPSISFGRRLLRGLAYPWFQLALHLPFVGRSAAGLGLPFRGGGAPRQPLPAPPRRPANPARG